MLFALYELDVTNVRSILRVRYKMDDGQAGGWTNLI